MRWPVFIVGMPRSGTSLLSVILSAHSQLAISPETHYFTKYRKWCEKFGCLQDSPKKERYLKWFLTGPEIRDMAFSSQELSELLSALSKEPTLTHEKIFQTVLESYSRKQDKPFWGEKTPDHMTHVPIISDLFPTAVFVCIVRDPRDVSLSWQAVTWNTGNVYHHAKMWRNYCGLSDMYSMKYADRYIEVRYEDLLQDTEYAVQKICDFLGLEFENRMLLSYNLSQNVDVEREPWKKKVIDPIDPTNAMKWIHAMPEEDKVIVNIIAADKLCARGYDSIEFSWSLGLLLKVIYRIIENEVVILGRSFGRLVAKVINAVEVIVGKL